MSDFLKKLMEVSQIVKFKGWIMAFLAFAYVVLMVYTTITKDPNDDAWPLKVKEIMQHVFLMPTSHDI